MFDEHDHTEIYVGTSLEGKTNQAAFPKQYSIADHFAVVINYGHNYMYQKFKKRKNPAVLSI